MSKCYANAVVAIAEAEIGYHEKASNKNLDSKTANAGSANYTRYANEIDTKYPDFYNGRKNGYAWCDLFVDWCFITAFGLADALRLLCQPEKSAGAGCTYSLRYYKNKGQFYPRGNTPKRGDQIFFGNSVDNVAHTGIVYAVDASKVYTVEGNTSDQVARRSYALNYYYIVGYGRPKYDAEESGGAPAPTPSTPSASGAIKVGSTVRVKQGAKTYNGGGLASYVYNRDHVVSQLNGDRAVITFGGVVVAAVNVNDLTVAGAAAKIEVGSTVRVKQGAKTYLGGGLASFVYNRDHVVSQLNGDRAVITFGGVVVAAVNVADLTLV